MAMNGILFMLMFIATAARADHELKGRDIVLGREIYVQNCAACHGTNLEGQPSWRSSNEVGMSPAPPHDVTGHTWHHDNALLFEYTKIGGKAALAARGIIGFNSGMPAFQDLITDNNIWHILAYIRSTWPVQARQFQASLNSPH